MKHDGELVLPIRVPWTLARFEEIIPDVMMQENPWLSWKKQKPGVETEIPASIWPDDQSSK